MPSLPRHRFTGQEVMRMAELGIVGEHLELLNGDLIETPPQGPIHSSLVSALGALLYVGYPSDRGFVVRTAMPLTEPEPDLALIRGAHRDFRGRHPRGVEAVLAIEVAYSSLDLDRAKVDLYAAGGVPVYWLIDIAARATEVYTKLASGRYQEHSTVGAHEALALPGGLGSMRLSEYF